MKHLSLSLMAVLLSIALLISWKAFAQDGIDDSDITVRCEPMPLPGTEQVAKILKGKLVVPGACPAGQFPRKYKSGKDIPDGWACVELSSAAKKILPRSGQTRAIFDLEEAKSVAEILSQPELCPPDSVLRNTLDNNPHAPVTIPLAPGPQSGENNRNSQTGKTLRLAF